MPPTINDKKWPKTVKSIVLWVAKYLGVKKPPPLKYIICMPPNPPPEADDPAFEVSNSDCVSHQDAMIARGPF